MSRLRADSLVNYSGSGSPNFKSGVTGAAVTFTGDVTAANGSFTGNVTIGGTLTYQDVTHVDSVGIITAQQGIQVSANGVTVSGVGTFNSPITVAGIATINGGGLDVTGVITATSYTGDGSSLSGVSPSVSAVASGTLSNGSPVVLNTDGTVSKVAASSPSIGSSSEFLDKSLGATAIGYDESAQRVVLAISHPDSPYRGQVYVGVVTASDNSVHWGSATNLQTTGTQQATPHRVIYDPSSQKTVILYDSSSTGSVKGYAVVGTVTGLGITFGTPVVYEDDGQAYDSDAVYDPVNEKIIIAYKDVAGDGNGGYGKAVVGTVSGDVITFGSTYTFESAATWNTNISYDPVANKVLITYRDAGNSNYGTAIVGTVSGNAITFGTASVFASVVSIYTDVSYNSKVGKHLIAYRDNTNSDVGKALMATVSGDTVTFGSTITFEDGFSAVGYTTPLYDSKREKSVIFAVPETGGSPNYENSTAYVCDIDGDTVSIASTTALNTNRNNTMFDATYDPFQARFITAGRNNIVDGTNSSAAIVFDPGTNLFTDNFLGFSNAAYTNGQTATVQIAGAVDDAQSGLTTASVHYVQTDGTLSTTAGTPSVEAGLALSATEIAIKA